MSTKTRKLSAIIDVSVEHLQKYGKINDKYHAMKMVIYSLKEVLSDIWFRYK